MASKHERYYSGPPVQRDPSKPLPGEVPPGRKQLFVGIGAVIILVGAGVIIGLTVAPEPPEAMKKRVTQLEAQLAARQKQIAELKRTLNYQNTDMPMAAGVLQLKDRERHDMYAKRYSTVLRQVKAQPAAELVEWFVNRWNLLLDRPQPDDRVTRRAAVLSLLVGGMARNLNPGDYVPWQAEFLHNANWLGDLHFDLDGDGLPGKRSSPNPKDGFAGVSICHIAMALNQSVTDAQVLVMPEMECDRPENRMSVFLQGRTLNDALDEFVRAVRREGFLVVEKSKKNIRLILIGKRKNRRR
ncbi:hypothetical protein ACFL6C_12175 [Myxococcota bacterium]